MNLTPLPLVPLGRTGLTVSRLSFGTVYFGRYGDNLTPESAADILAAPWSAGLLPGIPPTITGRTPM